MMTVATLGHRVSFPLRLKSGLLGAVCLLRPGPGQVDGIFGSRGGVVRICLSMVAMLPQQHRWRCLR
eukprot:5094533-Amphidinium_carterae.1